MQLTRPIIGFFSFPSPHDPVAAARNKKRDEKGRRWKWGEGGGRFLIDPSSSTSQYSPTTSSFVGLGLSVEHLLKVALVESRVVLSRSSLGVAVSLLKIEMSEIE